MRIYFFLVCLFFTSLAYSAGNDTATVVQFANHNSLNITAQLKYYTCGYKHVDSSLAYLYYNANKFLPIEKTNNEFINDGYISSEKWFAVAVENNAGADISAVLEFISSGLNEITCYEVNDVQRIISISSSVKDSVKQGALSQPVIFNISLTADEKKLLLFHTINTGHLLYIPAHIYTLNYFREFDNNKNNFFGIFKGIFLFIILFNLLIFISTFDKIYLFYLLYALCISFFALNEGGTVAYDFFPLNFFSGQTFLLCGFSAWLILMQYFLTLSKTNFIFYRTLQTISLLDLLDAFIPFVTKFFSDGSLITAQTIYQYGFHVLFAANLLFIIITNISRLSDKNKLALFYGIANIPVIAGTIIYYTNYYGITNIQFGWLNPVALGLSIETFALSFGFAYRFNLISKDKTQLLLQINKQQQETTQQIIEAQEAERKRIAEDLHDELGSNLAAIKVNLQAGNIKNNLAGEKYDQIITMIENASNDARRIAHNLMPPEFNQTNLHHLIAAHISNLNKDNDRFQFTISGENNHLDKQKELFIYRIILELTNNIVRHAAATEASIQLIYYADYMEIMAEDNGIGFSNIKTEGIGLNSIKSRVSYLHGDINIDTGKYGTTILIHIPYKQKDIG